MGILTKGLNDHTIEEGLHEPEEFLFYLKRDKKIVGGCYGLIHFHYNLVIDQLWIDKPLRHLGYGTKLINAVENLARKRHCPLISVYTMSYQASDFYKKLGYEVEYKRDGYPYNHSLYMFRKDLEKSKF